MMNPATTTLTNTLTPTEVTGGLDAILNTDKFMASPQMSAFLKYVVEQTLIGNTRRIKAFTVGIEALGKPASFDPQTDPSVRVLAKRLRSSLDTYYAQNLDTDVFIEMKPGSYVPKFLRRSEMPVSAPANMAPSYPVEQATSTMPALSSSTAALGTPIDTAAAANHEATDADQNIVGQSTASTPATHLSVQQHTKTADEHENTSGDNTMSMEERSECKSSISQLWQAYKSTSRVA